MGHPAGPIGARHRTDPLDETSDHAFRTVHNRPAVAEAHRGTVADRLGCQPHSSAGFGTPKLSPRAAEPGSLALRTGVGSIAHAQISIAKGQVIAGKDDSSDVRMRGLRTAPCY